jgi:hypothetical protein
MYIYNYIYISDPHKFRMQVPKLKCPSRNDAVSFKHCDAFNLQKQGNQPKLQHKKKNCLEGVTTTSIVSNRGLVSDVCKHPYSLGI